MGLEQKWPCTHFLLQTNLLQSQPSHLALPPHPRVRRPPWSGQSRAGLTPFLAAMRPSSSWCVKARSGDSRLSARRTLPSRGSCHSASTTCHPHCNARPTSRPRTLVSWEVLEVRLTKVDGGTCWPSDHSNFCVLVSEGPNLLLLWHLCRNTHLLIWFNWLSVCERAGVRDCMKIISGEWRSEKGRVMYFFIFAEGRSTNFSEKGAEAL